MDNNLVLGDNGMAFATDGNAVVALNASSLAPIWTYTSQGGDELVAATSGGGVLLRDFSLGGIQLDSNGTAGSPLASLQHATAIQYAPPLFDPATGSMFGEWATDAGGILSASASTYLPVAISEWNTPDGNAENQRSVPKFDLELVWCVNNACNGLYDAQRNPSEPMQNVAFQYLQDNPQENLGSTINLTATQIGVVEQFALQAFQQAFSAYASIHVGSGHRGTNNVYVVGETAGLSCGGTPECVYAAKWMRGRSCGI